MSIAEHTRSTQSSHSYLASIKAVYLAFFPALQVWHQPCAGKLAIGIGVLAVQWQDNNSSGRSNSFDRLSALHCRYGIDPAGKLAIGSKIATELLAKLLDDLRASKEESLATLTGEAGITITWVL